jgi:hypothetical protein
MTRVGVGPIQGEANLALSRPGGRITAEVPMRRPPLCALLLITLQVVAGVAGYAAEGDAEVLHMYDLTDLLEPVLDAPSPLVLREDQRSPTPTKAQPSNAEKRDEFLRQHFESSMAALISAHSEMRGTTLFVTGTKVLHDHIGGELTKLRAQSSVMIKTGVIAILMDPKERQEHYALSYLAWHDLPGSPGQVVAELDHAHWSKLAEQINAKEADLIVVDYPGVTSFSDQIANASRLADFPYPKLQFTASGPSVGQGIEQVGDSITIRATATDDHRFIHVVVDYLNVSILSIAKINLGLQPDGKPAIAEEPVLWRVHEHIDQAIPNGEAIIVTTGAYLEKDHAPRAGFLVVQSEIIDPVKEAQVSHELAGKRKAKAEAAKAAEQKTKAEEHVEVPPPKVKGANDF